MASSTSTEHVRPLVFCGPSGVGKGTLLARLLAEYPKYFAKAISHTSRAPRQGETNGVSYHFFSKDEFEQDISAGKFIEYQRIHGNLYGMSTAAVQTVSASGRICILEIDVQGAETIRAKGTLNPFYFFILPPAFQSLKERLLKRGTESQDVIQTRLETAEKELKFIEQTNWFDVKIVNDDLENSYNILKASIFAMYPNIKEKIEEEQNHQKNDSPHYTNGNGHAAHAHTNGHSHAATHN